MSLSDEENICNSLGVFGLIFLLVWVGFSIFIYLLPLFIAERRKAKHTLAIGLINLLLGWTLLAWIAMLIWAITDEKKR